MSHRMSVGDVPSIAEVGQSIGFVAVDPGDAEELSRLGHTCLVWSADRMPSLRDFDRVIVVARADVDGQADALRAGEDCCNRGARDVRMMTIPGLGTDHRDLRAWCAVPGGDLDDLIRATLLAPKSSESGRPPARESQAECLLRLAEDATLFHDPAGRTYAVVRVDGRSEVQEIASTGFRRWLKRMYYDEQGRPPSAQAFQDALGVIDSRATFDGEEQPVYVRIAASGAKVYIDLGDVTRRAVEVDATGWWIVTDTGGAVQATLGPSSPSRAHSEVVPSTSSRTSSTSTAMSCSCLWRGWPPRYGASGHFRSWSSWGKRARRRVPSPGWSDF